MTFVQAPDVGTYSTRTQYLTAREFMAAPTGVSVSQLVPNGSTAQNMQALEMQIQRASAMADNFCNQVIAATVDTQAGMYTVRPGNGCSAVVRVPLDYSPILGVIGVQIGAQPSTMMALTDYTNVWIGKKVVTIPVNVWGDRLFATVQYVNGYANTAITTAGNAGDMFVTVASPLGIMPGQQINVQGATTGETVTVSPTYTPATDGINITVPITTPLVNAYQLGDTVTTFPQDIKQAIILLTKTLILTPGDQAIVIPTYTGQPTHSQALAPSVSDDLSMAWDMLAPYRRVK